MTRSARGSRGRNCCTTLTRDARTRFRREAQVVARLQPPGIVSVFDYGTLPEGGASW
jgi:hypothetical protein